MSDALIARRAAIGLLIGISREKRLLSELIADAEGPLKDLSGPDRARAQRLALAALRRAEAIDALLAPHMRTAPNPETRAILRLAITELAERPDEAHGIVSAAVDLARENPRSTKAAGFVNALLRRAAISRLDLPAARLPQWLREPLLRQFGKVAVRGMEAAHLAGPMLDITLRDPSAAEAWAERLGATLLPTGSLRLAPGVQVSGLPGYEEGAWWIQDAAAALPARILDVQPGERVLDMCAAPGGKTMQMAAAGGEVTALDLSESRMARLRENLGRTGLQATTVVGDGLTWGASHLFDAILLDAPCSATGTIRRHPELPLVREAGDIPGLVSLQSRMIDHAIQLLAPGGRLVFCTCSLLPEEGEQQFAAALGRHPEMSRDQKAVAGWPGTWDAKGGGLRLRPDFWPEIGGMDGFFIGAMRKAG